MKRITNLEEMQSLNTPELRAFLEQKLQDLFEAYQVSNMNEIGCFLLLSEEETAFFEVSEMEFVEVLQFKNECYLHGVSIMDESYGEDTYLPIEVRSYV